MKLKRVIALGLCVSTVLASTFVSATPTETSELASAQVTVVEESSDSLPEAFTETALDETESQASESESTEAVRHRSNTCSADCIRQRPALS